MAIHRHGRLVKEVRGAAAARLIDALHSADAADVQLKLAKVTGQYRFGNERAGIMVRRDKRRGKGHG